MKDITVLIIDDHRLLVEMYTQLLRTAGHIKIVGTGQNLGEALELMSSHQPDIVILDINLGGDSGFTAVPLFRVISPATKIIAVSMHDKPVYAQKMLELGAKAYVTKSSPGSELFTAIDTVQKDEVYICEELRYDMSVQSFPHEVKPVLTTRELEIVNYLREGYTSREIADKRNVAVKTVEVHRYNILKKMKLKNTASLVNYINTEDVNLFEKKHR